MKLLLLSFVTLWVSVASDEICCEGLGCFSDDPPFSHLPLPNCHTPTFALYTNDNPSTGQYITRDYIPDVYEGSRRTILLIHGWSSSENGGWLHRHKDALIDKEDANVVIVGWGGNTGAGDIIYPRAASTTRTVGAEAGFIVDMLVSDTSSTYGQMYCIGHSLGGHVCGHTGRAASGPFGRITGLDPAGPWFENYPNEAGLYTDCASFVDVIHTNGKGGFPMNYGTNKPLGHIDFYPAAGGLQPGCNLIDLTKYTDEEIIGSCSHSLAYTYMQESIESDCFHACDSCSDWQNLPGSCSDCGTCGIMGYGAQTGGGGNGLKLVDVVDDDSHCVGTC